MTKTCKENTENIKRCIAVTLQFRMGHFSPRSAPVMCLSRRTDWSYYEVRCALFRAFRGKVDLIQLKAVM